MPVEPLTATQTVVAGADFAIKQGTGILSYLTRKYGYVKRMQENYDKLMKEYSKLCAQEEDVRNKLERNETEVEETNECKHWRNEVKKIKDDINELKTEYLKVSKCFCGLCPFCYLLNLGRRIVEKIGDVVSLREERGKISILIIKKAPAPHIRNPTNRSSEFQSIDGDLRMLREYLRNENIKTIGVRGPIGVGKTTIMNCLQQEMEKCNDFEIVFWLKKYKSYLLLLDEVFSNIDLEKVGINDEQNGKVVFASRYIDVCEHGDEEIEVKRLSSMDAQNMFWEIVGVHLKDNPHIKTEAELIIKFCSGMPFLIKMIGNNLATKIRCQPTNADIVAIWRNTKHKLYSPTGKLKQELGEVYKLLQVEMEELSEDEKPCFLYLANFPAGHELHMDYIIECWRVEQFLNELQKAWGGTR
ncbi:probable disease resistance protein At1g15890 [Pistacia vera]|uniref:probable disease resistance protein At1g15890 n=1 Tax=Pistacia vera TaxID=55513 RepID=UPI00126304FE|nr:probable disease resistance protein At1g15890 [Pistacia vera]